MLRGRYRMFLAGFVLDFAVMAGLTATPFYVIDKLHGSAGMLGAFGGAQAAAYALVCLVSSGFVHRAKNGLLWAVFGVSLFTLVYAPIPLLRNPVLCCVAATAGSGALGFVWPALHSWVGAEPQPELRARHMGWFNLSWSSGFAVSPLFAGPLYDTSFFLPYVLLFGLGLGVAALVWSLPHEKEYFGTATAEMLEARQDHDRSSEAYLYCGWSATLLANALVAVLRSIYPERVARLVQAGELRLFFESAPARFLTSAPATKFSWLAFALAGSTALAFLIMGRTSRWHHRFSLLFWLQMGAGGAFWLLGHTRSLVVMALCFAMVGSNLGVAFFSSVYYCMANPEHKHRRAAINEASVGVGGLAGSIVFGYLIHRWGLALPFHLTPLFVAVAITMQVALVRLGTRMSIRNNARRGPALTNAEHSI